MTSMPSGTVSFLFTDIEGSSALWELAPNEMTISLARHDESIRSSILSANGHIFKTMGDAFCVAFANPSDALKAMLHAQMAISKAQ